MIQSMTGFFSENSVGPCGRVTWELKSVNHRYLDFQCRLPNRFLPAEMELRKKTSDIFSRGKVEATLHFVEDEAVFDLLTVNETLVKELQKSAQKINNLLQKEVSPLKTIEILRWPGVLQENTEIKPDTQIFIISCFEKALKGLKIVRMEEGKRITAVLAGHLLQLQTYLKSIQALAPNLQEVYKNRLLQSFKDAKIALDTGRLEQEMVLALQKMDVTEEIDRLTMHILEVKRVLEQGGEVGKRLDFLMQELNREANTLASKSPTAELAHYAVDMKVHIEKMREQIQNIE